VTLETVPEKINQNAYEAWFFKLRPADQSEVSGLLDAEGYRILIASQN
jgi:glycine cleavage system H protein